ncbi:MAG: DNA-binding protein [Bacillota bacterium]|nr:DNA-binding protein [Bacillota bacterium]
MAKKLICDKCKVEMEEIEVQFKYLSRSFRYKVPRCPECGQVSLPEDLVDGKMADVEAMIEEK